MLDIKNVTKWWQNAGHRVVKVCRVVAANGTYWSAGNLRCDWRCMSCERASESVSPKHYCVTLITTRRHGGCYDSRCYNMPGTNC